MNKAILKSVSPKRCEQIASGKCTVLLSKTKPKLETPFKVYIYCTNGKMLYDISKEDYLQTNKKYILGSGKSNKVISSNFPFLNRKVIGEFVCERVEDFSKWEYDYPALLRHIDALTGFEGDYPFWNKQLGGQKKGYALHISQLKIYDTPKELGDFKAIKRCKDWRYFEMCSDVCGYAENNQCHNGIITKRVTRPPQSGCYVEELEA